MKNNFKQCSYCDYQTKFLSNLNRHLAHRHDIKLKWFSCSFCTSRFKQKILLQYHLANKHNINVIWHPCHLCASKFKHKGLLKQHLADKHYVNVTWHPCHLCSAQFKQSGQLKAHLSNVHDEGKYECQLCLKNVFRLNAWTCETTKKELNICRTCFNKITGFSTRAEQKMVHAIRQDPILGPFIVLHDQKVAHKTCQTRRRPDLILASEEDWIIIIECDENQHSGYTMECEQGRMEELWDEFPHSQVIFVRWNPDGYQPPPKQVKIPILKRLLILVNFLKQLIQKIPQHPLKLPLLYYLFFSQKNPNLVLAPKFQTRFIYKENMKVAIIGTSGRYGKPLTALIYQQMVRKAYEIITDTWRLNPDQVTLVSGGSSWADHVALDLSLQCAQLELHLPCEFNDKFIDNGQVYSNPGQLLNKCHAQFTKVLGRNTLQELATAKSQPTTTIHVWPGFYARNDQVAQADYLIAFGWDVPQPQIKSGTNYTWFKAKGTKIFVNLNTLIL